MDESERIKKVYALRDQAGKRQLYSLFNPAALFMTQQREKNILEILNKHKLTDLEKFRILDLGCGNGSVLRNFLQYGAQPENCYGIDLLPGRIAEARKLSPNINFQCSNAENFPYETDFFDMIICFTVFSSVLEKTMQDNLVNQMHRTLKPKGVILWYDYHMDNPRNPDVKGVKKKRIHELFPGCVIFLRRITLAPPITRLFVPYSRLSCYLLEKLKMLNSHYLGLIKLSA